MSGAAIWKVGVVTLTRYRLLLSLPVRILEAGVSVNLHAPDAAQRALAVSAGRIRPSDPPARAARL